MDKSIMKRAAVGTVLLALALAPARARGQGDSTWRDHERALQIAREAGDTVRYRAQLNAIYAAIGAIRAFAVCQAFEESPARQVPPAGPGQQDRLA